MNKLILDLRRQTTYLNWLKANVPDDKGNISLVTQRICETLIKILEDCYNEN